ncbi:MAG: enolase, partial [Nanoarchaeota archaeon]
YDYKNPPRKFDKQKQIKYLKFLIERFNILYVEDGLEENDFTGFSILNNKRQLIVGDDLTTTNPERLKQAIRMKSINAIIIKPNQIGSLLKVKEVIDIAKKNNIKTIISHRSGETKDNTIADLGVGFNCDFIKTGIYGSVRKSKLKRVMRIEKKI